MKNLFDLSSYDYDLPKHLIASHPVEKRDHSRLMVIDRKSGAIDEMRFYELAGILGKGDQIILNDTKVIKARLYGKKSTGACIEIFLVKPIKEKTWEVLAKPGRKLRQGDTVIIGDELSGTILETLDTGNKLVEFSCEGDFMEFLEHYGHIPLPHYMEREAEQKDEDRYQTIYAQKRGALAAPTAGLHFTPELLNQLKHGGVDIQTVTLHVGLGTFKPVQVEDIRTHEMHSEIYHVDRKTAEEIQKQWKRQICVGTTTCRTLESCQGKAMNGETDIFIYPGYKFQFVQALLTNFHLPKSSLLMLVSAFGGYELIMEAYQKAVEREFRFYSYGDAMLIL